MAPYRNSEHCAKAFSVLNLMRKYATFFTSQASNNSLFILYRKNYLCDVVLLTSDQQKEFPAHKAVLASCSPYFYAMFHHRFDENHQNRITLKDIDPKALGLLLDFLYTSEIQVSQENAQVLKFLILKSIQRLSFIILNIKFSVNRSYY